MLDVETSEVSKCFYLSLFVYIVKSEAMESSENYFYTKHKHL